MRSWFAILLVSCTHAKSTAVCVGADCGASSEPTPAEATPQPTPRPDTDPPYVPDDTGDFEVCNGIDDDGDGLIDEDPVDGIRFYADADGDGFGDVETEVIACEPGEGITDDVRDCDDTDPNTHPLAPDVLDGSDNDCDGRIDETDVAFVASWQCISDAGRAAATDLEVAQIRAFLLEIDLTMERFDAAPQGSIPATVDLTDYSLVFYSKCGWAWEAYNTGDIVAIEAAAASESATFFFGDDMAFRMTNTPTAEPFVMLAPSSNNGGGSPTMVFDSASTHPAYAGPYGTPEDYSYAWDMDVTTVSRAGAITLATHGSARSPAFVAWQHPTTRRRQATLLASVYNANHGSPGSTARLNGEMVFKNTVTWLLRL